MVSRVNNALTFDSGLRTWDKGPTFDSVLGRQDVLGRRLWEEALGETEDWNCSSLLSSSCQRMKHIVFTCRVSMMWTWGGTFCAWFRVSAQLIFAEQLINFLFCAYSLLCSPENIHTCMITHTTFSLIHL